MSSRAFQNTVAVFAFAEGTVTTYLNSLPGSPPADLVPLIQRIKVATHKAFEAWSHQPLTRKAREAITDRMRTWEGQTWKGKPRHVVTHTSFALRLIEDLRVHVTDRRRRAVLDELIGAVRAFQEYHTEKSGEKVACFVSGDRAADVWDGLDIGA